jgi:hypothetical protein
MQEMPQDFAICIIRNTYPKETCVLSPAEIKEIAEKAVHT